MMMNSKALRSYGFLFVLLGLASFAAINTILAISTQHILVQASSPVMEGEVSIINIVIGTEVGISGVANLFIDEIFYFSIGGSAGSDGKIYFSTGWSAVGVGDHVLRVTFFEDGYPTQPISASTIITVTASDGYPSTGDHILTINVIDSTTGAGISGKPVFAFVNIGEDPLLPEIETLSGVTDEDGIVSLSVEIDNYLTLAIIASDYTSQYATSNYAYYYGFNPSDVDDYITISLTPVDPLEEDLPSEVSTRTLNGYVQDFETAIKLSGVVIEVVGPEYKTEVTDGHGWFAFSDLPSGTYSLTASLDGYQDSVIESLDLNNDLVGLVVFLSPVGSPVLEDNYVIPEVELIEHPQADDPDALGLDINSLPIILSITGLVMIGLSYRRKKQ